MKRHAVDVIALVFGFAFVMIGGAFVAIEQTDSDLDPAWIAAGGLVTLGLVALAATIARGAHRGDPALEDDE